MVEKPFTVAVRSFYLHSSSGPGPARSLGDSCTQHDRHHCDISAHSRRSSPHMGSSLKHMLFKSDLICHFMTVSLTHTNSHYLVNTIHVIHIHNFCSISLSEFPYFPGQLFLPQSHYDIKDIIHIQCSFETLWRTDFIQNK